jgi:hypothetical protein
MAAPLVPGLWSGGWSEAKVVFSIVALSCYLCLAVVQRCVDSSYPWAVGYGVQAIV